MTQALPVMHLQQVNGGLNVSIEFRNHVHCRNTSHAAGPADACDSRTLAFLYLFSSAVIGALPLPSDASTPSEKNPFCCWLGGSSIYQLNVEINKAACMSVSHHVNCCRRELQPAAAPSSEVRPHRPISSYKSESVHGGKSAVVQTNPDGVEPRAPCVRWFV